ncbi:MAG: TldD/PmbA family protein [Nitrospira sp.]|nr:TldD/PmbA family protein [bacterium]MBL7049905.1 TldD/PmbA family protein [Nitrospira sp.]
MDETYVQDIIKKAGSQGCDAAEVFMKNASGITVEVKNGEVDAFEVAKDFCIGVKIIKGKRMGFSFTTDKDQIDRIVDEAIEGARWTNDDEYLCISEGGKPQDVKVFDEVINKIDEKDLIRDAILLEESALKYDSRIKKVRKAEVSAGSGITRIVNSNGLDVSYSSTYCSASVSTLAEEDGGESQMGWEYAGSRRKKDIDLIVVGQGAAKRALQLLGSRKIETLKVPVILSPSVAIDFLEILSASLSADAVQKGRSFLSGKLGKKIISSTIDIVDDGTRPWGAGTKPVDDEGTTTENKTLIADGVLNSYLHNAYTAKKDGSLSTGNAVRAGAKSLTGVGITNFYLRPAGNNPGSELIPTISKGVLITSAMGVHTANPVSGDFSVGISGIWIENGQLQYPVKEAIISGNILELFNKVEGIGNDLTFYGSAGAPSLLIGDMDISA